MIFLWYWNLSSGTKQVLYYLSHAQVLFCFRLFFRQGLMVFPGPALNHYLPTNACYITVYRCESPCLAHLLRWHLTFWGLGPWTALHPWSFWLLPHEYLRLQPSNPDNPPGLDSMIFDQKSLSLKSLFPCLQRLFC
jgi:hypothetical protein